MVDAATDGGVAHQRRHGTQGAAGEDRRDRLGHPVELAGSTTQEPGEGLVLIAGDVLRVPAVAQLEADHGRRPPGEDHPRSEEHTSELQSLMRISYAVFCLQKKK